MTTSLGGLGVFPSWGVGYNEWIGMEELAKDWKKLSLSNKEDNKFDLSKNKKEQKYTPAAKFFTRHSVNIEAVATTFRPLWRTKLAM